MLTIRLLGSPTFQLENNPLTGLITGRAAALFIYLIVTRRPQPRALLADLLWDNTSEHQARINLRYQLRDLRKVVGNYVIVTNDTVAFNQELPHWVDVTAFSMYLATTPISTVHTLQSTILQELLELYVREFLTGFHIDDAAAFENWVLLQRRQLHELVVHGLQLRTQQHLEQGEYEEALTLNHYLLILEPWREEAHRQRMLLLAHTGQRSAALKQYTICCQTLTEELDAQPMEQTTTLYEQIKSGHWFTTQQAIGHQRPLPIAITSFPQGRFPANSNGISSNKATAAYNHAVQATASRFDLGAMPDPGHFYGRQPELQALHQWIGHERARLIAILGMSGQGKSALAATFIQEVMEDVQCPAYSFTQVIWRSLHSAPSCTEILQGWLQQLSGARIEELPTNFDRLVTQLFDLLQEHNCLFVLDGVEALLVDSMAGDECHAEAYRPGCNGYQMLFQLFFQRRHRSCLLLTGRTRPDVLTQLEERNGAFYSLELGGLAMADSAALLAAHGISNEQAVYQKLHQRYAGNPLLLSRAANLIYDLFGGDVAAFLEEEVFFLGDIGAVPAAQLAQLSPLERRVIQAIAQAERPLYREQLWQTLTPLPSKQQYFQALQNLQRLFLIRQADAQIQLSDLLLSYILEQSGILTQVYLPKQNSHLNLLVA
jgi:DNA-binding SARP family transcriptional activator